MPARLASSLMVLCLLTAAGCSSGDRSGDSSAERAAQRTEQQRQLQGAPRELKALHARGGELLPGGVAAFRKQMRSLRGRPVVVNKWASWCGPCRTEFPHLREQAAANGRDVAFVGVDSDDDPKAAKRFLDGFVLSFPSFSDPDLEIAKEIKAVAAFPSTVFYDRRGRIVHLKQGQYSTERELADDIDRFAR